MESINDKPLVNRVADSGIITLNLEEAYPDQTIKTIDLKDFLFMELILKEKDFRKALKALDWSEFQDVILCVYCSVDVIIPVWAYMLIASHAHRFISRLHWGDTDSFIRSHYEEYINTIDPLQYEDKRVVIKGCSDRPVPESAYMLLTQRIIPAAQSVMYGEPCSTVPVFKRPRKV